MQTRDLNQGNVFQTLFLFSIPFMLSTMFQTLYSMVDMIVVGNFVGKEGLSAVANGSQLMELIIVFCVGFSTAGQIIISQYVGAKKTEKIWKINGTLFTVLIIFSVVLTCIGLLGGGALLKILSTPSEAFSYARSYVLICSGGILFTGLYNMISAIFRGMGDSRHPLYFIAIASIVNIILDLLFVGVLKWAVAGAALATVIGQGVSVVCSLIFLQRHQQAFYFALRKEYMKPDKAITRMLFRLGIPLALQSSAVMISFLFVNKMINGLGVAVSAVFGAGQKLRNIPGIMTQAIGLGATAMTGQAFGANLQKRVSQIYLYGCLINTIISVSICAVFMIWPQECFRLFTSDESVLAYAPMFMLTLLIEMPAKIFMPSGGALISGCGNTRLSMTLAFCDAFIGRIFMTWLLGKYFGMGAFGYFLGYTSATYVTSVPQIIYYLMGTWKNRKRLIEEYN